MVDKYEITVSFDKNGDYTYVVKKHVKRHFIDDYVHTYTYQEAVDACHRLNNENK